MASHSPRHGAPRQLRLTQRGGVALGAAGVLVLVLLSMLVVGSGDDSSDTEQPAAAGPAAPAEAPASAGPPAGSGSAATVPAGGPGLRPAPDEAVVQQGDGNLVVVPGSDRGVGATGGPEKKYQVEVEGGLGVDPAAFATEVQRTLEDPRGWGADGEMHFTRVDSGPVSFRVALASPDTTDELCAPLDTGGTLSCENNGRAALNVGRWLQGADAYGDDLATYRQYLVTHEVGHALGHSHRYGCDERGRAPVMLQQTKGLAGCSANPWPSPDAPTDHAAG